jgi:hypothetical protein
MNVEHLAPRYYEVLQNFNAYQNQRRLSCITFDFNIPKKNQIIYTFTGIPPNSQDLRVIEGTLYPSNNSINFNNSTHVTNIENDNCWTMTAIDTIPPSSQDRSWCILAMETKMNNDNDENNEENNEENIEKADDADTEDVDISMDKVDWMIVTDRISQMTFALISDIHNFTLRDIVWNQVYTLFPTTNFRNITGNCPVYDPKHGKEKKRINLKLKN